MSNKNAKLEIEIGVTPYSMEALTDSGDHTNFTTQAALLSETNGNEPDVRPDGVLTGGLVTPAVSGNNDEVDISLLSCYLAGVQTSVAGATDQAVTRPVTAVSKVNSITVTSGGAFAVVVGTDGASTAFSETRGAAGGPPFIPVGSIEIAQVRLTSDTAAVIGADEIYAVIGTHRELSGFPAFETKNADGMVEFKQPLPASHTGSTAKGVYASYAEPIFLEQDFGNDFIPAETANSITSNDTYTGPVGSSSSSIGQGSFTAYLNDGITDAILSMINQNIWVRFYQNRYKNAHILTQGLLGIARTFNVSNQPTVSVTITAEKPSVNRAV